MAIRPKAICGARPCFLPYMKKPKPTVDTANPAKIVLPSMALASAARRSRVLQDLLGGHFAAQGLGKVDAFRDQHRGQCDLCSGQEGHLAEQRADPVLLRASVIFS